MRGQIPRSVEGVDSYRAAATDIPDIRAISGLLVNSSRSPNRDRTREMLEAMAERERRELDALEKATAVRPEFRELNEAPIENARKRIQDLEHVLENWPIKEEK
jgi:hypothetical protein